MAKTLIEPIAYAGWPNCYRMTDGEVELIVTTDVGPRIIRYGFIGGQNVFAEFPDQLGKSGESWWTMRGGHRLWVAPEIVPDTYALDNGPVSAKVNGGGITLLQPVEPETGLQKEMTIAFTPAGSVTVKHRLENSGGQTRRVSIWAVTQMAMGGLSITTFPPRGCHEDCLQPTNPMIMWAYTDFSDKRWLLTKSYLILKQDPADDTPQKAGVFNQNTRVAYLLGTDLFLKRYQADPRLAYPDFQASCEVFTNGGCLELETLGPLADLHPGQSSTHMETWSLHRGVQLNGVTEAEIDRAILPLFA
ncbi:MAG TPA: hypothetical protein VK604_01255 [Bryobacteraceae bacterium]|nr:hypothetical protein [Bryobacteraceae bacterium]